MSAGNSMSIPELLILIVPLVMVAGGGGDVTGKISCCSI
jgi:hypothetical protein